MVTRAEQISQPPRNGKRIEIQVREDRHVTPEERAWITRVMKVVDWGGGGPPGPAYTYAVLEWRCLVRLDGELACHAGVMKREILVGGRRLTIGGLGGVMTAPGFEGRGLATAAMRTLQEFLRTDWGMEFGLLTCRTHMVPFYRRLGWQVVEAPVLFQDADGTTLTLEAPHHTLVYPAKSSEWPVGTVDLRGLLI